MSDPTEGFYFDDVILMTKLPDPTSVGMAFYARPFHWLIFVLVGCGLVVSTLVLALIDRYGESERPGVVYYERQTRQPTFTASLAVAAETLFGALISRGNV